MAASQIMPTLTKPAVYDSFTGRLMQQPGMFTPQEQSQFGRVQVVQPQLHYGGAPNYTIGNKPYQMPNALTADDIIGRQGGSLSPNYSQMGGLSSFYRQQYAPTQGDLLQNTAMAQRSGPEGFNLAQLSQAQRAATASGDFAKAASLGDMMNQYTGYLQYQQDEERRRQEEERKRAAAMSALGSLSALNGIGGLAGIAGLPSATDALRKSILDTLPTPSARATPQGRATPFTQWRNGVNNGY